MKGKEPMNRNRMYQRAWSVSSVLAPITRKSASEKNTAMNIQVRLKTELTMMLCIAK
jgi:hypothetical protein